ncbi:RNA polymerase sigma factor [Paenibacillus sp. MBLB4367]|uniref:RNA polymerase sigma factor n=1 Tax=Paenibacillus sp. MBLB4367 TaxID=3384767 RepID=UPI00390835D9
MEKNRTLTDLMETYGKDMWNYAFFLTLRADIADDVMQDVFIKVYEKLCAFRGESSVRTWLLAITRNVVRDYQRSSWFRRVSLVERFLQRQTTSPSAEYVVIDALSREEVWREVLGLPKKLRETLLLYAHHHLSIAEIAGLLDISEGTVKSRMHRARAKINKQLNGEVPEHARC